MHPIQPYICGHFSESRTPATEFSYDSTNVVRNNSFGNPGENLRVDRLGPKPQLWTQAWETLYVVCAQCHLYPHGKFIPAGVLFSFVLFGLGFFSSVLSTA